MAKVKQLEDLVKEMWDTNMTYFDMTSDERLEESINIAKRIGVPEDRIERDVRELAKFMLGS